MISSLGKLLDDPGKKAKEKVKTISQWLSDGRLAAEELIAFAEPAKDPAKATCIEAMEFATRQNPGIAGESMLAFVTKMLAEPAPRVKWESAKVTGNIAHRFPSKLAKPISQLLKNATHEGTVVRWAAAFALGEIAKLKTKHNKDLLPALKELSDAEEDNAIKKKYLDAIKKSGK